MNSDSKCLSALFDRRSFVRTFGAGSLGLIVPNLLGMSRKPPAPKPNIVVIFADDLGYADIGLHGCTDFATPNIDSIAAKGVHFTNGYASGAVCSPSRAGLMTGRSQARFGFDSNPDHVIPVEDGTPLGLPLSEITIADSLRQCGYATGMVGKWHLGFDAELNPLQRGFDEFYGFLGSLHHYFDNGTSKRDPITQNGDKVVAHGYMTDVLSREGSSFIERHRDGPFFLYLAYNAVHTPLMAKKETIETYGAIESENRRTYAAMVEAMDTGIGEILRALTKNGLEDNTIVFFVGDNGGAKKTGAYDNTPLRDYKGTFYEGGVRVPFLMQWPKKLSAGEVYDKPVSTLDIFATSTRNAGGHVPMDRTIDGVDLIPYLTGQDRKPPHEVLFWRRYSNHAIRKGDWKLVHHDGREPELYNLADDISETTDLAASNPETFRQMLETLERWKSKMKPPLWQPDVEYYRRRRLEEKNGQ